MATRTAIAYFLILLLIAGGGAMIWRMVYYSERNVRRRARRARRERGKEGVEESVLDERPLGREP